MVHAFHCVPTAGFYTSGDPLDGDFNKVDVIDRTPDGGKLIGSLTSGRPVNTTFMPTKMSWDDIDVEIPDFESALCISVSERARDLIELFDPDVHQFLPVDFYYGKTDKKQRRYFLIVCNRIDSMDHNKSTFVLKHILTTTNINVSFWVPLQDLVRDGESHLIPPHLPRDLKAKSDFVASLAKIGARHLWFDKFTSAGPWLSDALAAAIVSAGLTGIKLPNAIEAV